MDEKPVVVKEGFSAVQGCLLGAVILFVLILGITIVLAYRQFRENTATPSATAALVSALPAPVPIPVPVPVPLPAPVRALTLNPVAPPTFIASPAYRA